MNFAQYFYQLIAESPDKTRAGVRYTNWEQPDARTFIVGPDFYCLTSKPRITHATMLGHLSILVKERGFDIAKEMNYNQMWVKGNLSSLKPIFKLPPEQLMYRSNLMRYSHSHSKNILVGRLWLQNKVVSMWNDLSDININQLETIFDLIGNKFQTDASTFLWEVFEKSAGRSGPEEQAYTLDELEEKLKNPILSDDKFEDHQETRPTVANPQWDKLHLTPPDQKGMVMKNMGIKPKTAMGAQARFLRGESREF